MNGEHAEAGRGVGAFALLGEIGDTGGVPEVPPTVRDHVLLYADPGRACLDSRGVGEAEEAVAGRAAAFAAAVVREVGWAEEGRRETVVCVVIAGWVLSVRPASPPGRPAAEAGRVRVERVDDGESMFALSCRLSRFESVADRAWPLRALISANTCTSPTCVQALAQLRGAAHDSPCRQNESSYSRAQPCATLEHTHEPVEGTPSGDSAGGVLWRRQGWAVWFAPPG